MYDVLRQILADSPGPLRRQMQAVIAALVALNAGAWLAAIAVFHGHPALLGTAALAYSFGLRHAVDADHIAAIDNVTRKLIQEGRKPLLTGFWFSLGHSTIVVGLSLVVAATTVAVKDHFAAWQELGGMVGTAVSAGFLLLIAGFNLMVLIGLLRAFRRATAGAGRGGPVVFGPGHLHAHRHAHSHGGSTHVHHHAHAPGAEDHDDHPVVGGPLARLLRPLFRLISRSWHMYPLGLLFGLGFDTATEIGLLGITAAQATQGLPLWSILIFPALFAAGMALVDTTDGILMLGVYGWAFIRPLRKLYYNLTITALSVVIALAVGAIEALGLVADRWKLSGPFWDAIGMLGDHFGAIGYAIIGVFIGGWVLSYAFYRGRGYDRLDAQMDRQDGEPVFALGLGPGGPGPGDPPG